MEAKQTKEEKKTVEEKQEEEYKPKWARGKKINEMEFCKDFLALWPLLYVDGQFYSHKGREEEGKVRKCVFDHLSSYVSTGLGKKVTSLMDALRMRARVDTFEISETKIHCANGYYDLNRMEFVPEMEFCRFRLPVDFNPLAPEPVLWKRFLSELLEYEDIETLQEYMGYCLLPVNYAQKMLLILGKGGEGKSRIGVVMHHLFGSCMCNGSLSKVEHNQFARADLQHRLVMVDDDLRLEALNNTNYIKSIITAEQPMDLERKGIQSYQGLIRCRFLAFGNGNLRSLHDRSMGFFRRQIILTTKDRPADRVDDPYLAQRMRDELEGILLWCLVGTRRLLDNKMRFTLSLQTRRNILEAISEGNNTLDFMKSKGYIRFDREGEITTRSLYRIYRDWCEDNVLVPLPARSFTACLVQSAHQFGIEYSNRINGGNDRLVRGFRGVRSGYRE